MDKLMNASNAVGDFKKQEPVIDLIRYRQTNQPSDISIELIHPSYMVSLREIGVQVAQCISINPFNKYKLDVNEKSLVNVITSFADAACATYFATHFRINRTEYGVLSGSVKFNDEPRRLVGLLGSSYIDIYGEYPTIYIHDGYVVVCYSIKDKEEILFNYEVCKYDEKLFWDWAKCIPASTIFDTDHVFRYIGNLKVMQSVRVANEITIVGNVEITADVPIIPMTSSIKIQGKDKATLKLVSNSPMQPCIGCRTHTGMSYGRWEPGNTVCHEILLQDIDVQCISMVPNFSLGTYGDLQNNITTLKFEHATLECPEVHGSRMIKSGFDAPVGSTKRVSPMEYIIVPYGELSAKDYPPDLLAAWTLLNSYTGGTLGKLQPNSSMDAIAAGIDLAKLFGDKLNYDVFLNPMVASVSSIMMATTCCVIGMNYIEGEPEFKMESRKLVYLEGLLYNNEQYADEPVAGIQQFIKEHLNKPYKYFNQEQTIEFCYECIPTYFHNFDSNRTHYDECVLFAEQ